MDFHDALDVYGKTKSLGEVNATNFYNIRTSIIGIDKNKKSLLSWFLSKRKNSTVKGYLNYYWNGITTLQFAKLCHAIIEYNIKLPNLIHFVPANKLSKYQLLTIIAENFNRKDIVINPHFDINSNFKLDRTLNTNNKDLINFIWVLMGYKKAPTIQEMVKELADYVKK